MTRSIVVEPASVTNAQVSRVASTRSCIATCCRRARGMLTGDKRNELRWRSDATGVLTRIIIFAPLVIKEESAFVLGLGAQHRGIVELSQRVCLDV